MALFGKKAKAKVMPSKVVRRKRPVFTRTTVAPRIPTSMKKNEVVEKKDPFVFVYRLLWMTFFGITAYVLFFSAFLRISEISVIGNTTLSSSEITKYVHQQIDEKYYGNLTKNNILFISEPSLEDALKNNFKKLKYASVKTSFPHTMRIDVAERDALVVWCVADGCWYIDEEGHAYVQAESGRSETILTIQDESNQAINDEAVLEKNSIATIRELKEVLHSAAHIEINPEATTASRYSEELALTTKDGWILKINHHLPLQSTIDTLKLLLSQEITGERRQKLQYIDLRTENRAYYAVEGELVSAPETLDTEKKDALNHDSSVSTETTKAEAVPKKEKKNK